MERLIDTEILTDYFTEHDLAFEYAIKHQDRKELERLIAEIPTAYEPDKVVEKLENRRMDTLRSLREDKGTAFKYASEWVYNAWNEAVEIVKSGETGITADKNFARGIANFTEKHLKNDLIRIAEENWTDSQVKMLKGLICAAVNGIEYADAYEAVNRN